MKNLDIFFNKNDLPWVHLVWSNYYKNGKVPGETRKGSFWWRSMLKLLNTFKGISQANVGVGETIMLWVTYGMGEFFRIIIQNCSPLQRIA
jgi:hypothetical protein